MKPDLYVSLAMETSNKKLNQQEKMSNACLGMAGETGEVCDVIKKHLYQGHQINTNDLIKELGDVMWYIALMCNTFGFSLEQIMEANIEKLKRRYNGNFDSNLSINREDV